MQDMEAVISKNFFNIITEFPSRYFPLVKRRKINKIDMDIVIK